MRGNFDYYDETDHNVAGEDHDEEDNADDDETDAGDYVAEISEYSHK